ncbi:response regulator [Flavilitoribacter nigricans]|uniref:Response regulatory domain-containing protein n=1 Tax=Flavilitoribacter nigricans (strain ATCC 23147 / DSM 23189 / NBRC 102662 / NCIMB 1420 / SS-2) TaxID=1122177 RepID=A0A2D0N234_FLAN2|nr:response regulator [Flavilitoribacter nigricans]PHN02179.1 hypothetical protein CRP01_33120 [Flavilitoribacter nigricans DSM 23189 = NBRC 102662]
MNRDHVPHNFSILLLEDMPTDAVLISRIIRKKFPAAQIEVANDQQSYERLLNDSSFDIILSDFSIPGYSGIDALVLARTISPDVPFVYVTGTLNDEELVARAILRGATGYVLKQNLRRLPSVMTEAIMRKSAAREKARQRAALLQRQELLLTNLRTLLGGANLPRQSEMIATIDQLLDADGKSAISNFAG